MTHSLGEMATVRSFTIVSDIYCILCVVCVCVGVCVCLCVCLLFFFVRCCYGFC